MEQVEQIAPLRAQIVSYRSASERIAFVPTMGNLHQGHLELVRQAKQHADRVVVSIYVNPTQFGAGEDLDSYPRTLSRDCELLIAEGTDLLFTPDDAVMYGEGERANLTQIVVPGVSDQFCGASRPGHFTGVATVVTKLFNIVQPDVALFGQKDYQQLLVIRRLVEELNLPIEIIGVPTWREADGLAMSSRNGYLTAEERATAPTLNVVLQSMREQLLGGNSTYALLEAEGRKLLEEAGFEFDYLSIRRYDLEMPDSASKELIILAAAQLGATRLIDNCPLVLR